MNSSDYNYRSQSPSSYVQSESTFQTLTTYNQFGLTPSTAGIGFAIYPVYGGYGNTELLHNLPREEVNGCDYFSLDNAYQTITPCLRGSSR